MGRCGGQGNAQDTAVVIALKRIIFALCLVAPWSLLWLDGRLLFPYVTGKAWVFRSIVELAFALSMVEWSISRASRKVEHRRDPVVSSVLALLFAFLIWTAFCNLLGIDRYRSTWSNWERMGGLVDYLHWAMYLFCLLRGLNNARSRWVMLNLSLVIVLVAGLSLLDASRRGIATLGNPIYVGNLAVFGLFINAHLMAGRLHGPRWKEGLLKLLLLFAMLIMVAALFKSASRGPLLALLIGGAGALISIIFMLVRRGEQARVCFLLAGLLLAGVLLSLSSGSVQRVLRNSDSYLLQRFGHISLSNQTTADRLENWRIAADAASERPWLGWGQENYMIAFNQHYRSGVIDNAKLWFDRAHNAYLDVWLASGIPGLLLYLALLMLPLWMVARASAWSHFEKSALIGLLSAHMTKNMVGFDTFSSNLVWVSLLAVLIACQHADEPIVRAPVRFVYRPSYRVSLLSLLVLVAAAFVVYRINIRDYRENLRFARLIHYPEQVSNPQLMSMAKLPYADLRYAQNSKFEVFSRTLEAGQNYLLKDVEQPTLEQLYNASVSFLEQALSEQPANYRMKYNGAVLLARLGRFQAAALLMEQLTRAVPKRPVFWQTLAGVYTAQGREEAARKAHNAAKTLNPD